jgi:hypothetical protein
MVKLKRKFMKRRETQDGIREADLFTKQINR